MGFFRNLGLFDPPGGGTPRDPEGRFSEIRVVEDTNETDYISSDIVSVTEPLEEARQIYLHIVTEALNNVCQHSGAAGYCASQYYPKKNLVRFAIADYGIGLRNSLEAYNPNSDLDAIRLALKVGVSGGPRRLRVGEPQHMRNRGVGLTAIKKLVVGNGGRLTIRSGVSGFYIHSRGAGLEAEVPWPGTLVAAEMPRNQVNRSFRDAMEELRTELRAMEES